jgi:23S rRNA (guanosine2251-2'-O)-methyltransferase
MSKETTDNAIFIYGKNAVMGALEKRPDTVERVFLEKDKTFGPDFEDSVHALIKKHNLKKEIFVPNDLARELKEANHQGILAKVRIDELTVGFEFFLENLEVNENTCLVVLSELQDVQNVGAIIRSAVAFGASGILIPEHNQVQINPTIVKISSGTAFSIPLVKIGNLNNAIEKLKEKRFWIYGLDMHGEKTVFEEKFTEAAVFIIGNEGEGIREKTKENCDMLLNIPISENCESLNASVSCAVALYEWRKQKLTK